MTFRRATLILWAIVIAVVAWRFWPRHVPAVAPAPTAQRTVKLSPAPAERLSRIAQLAKEIPEDSVSPIAKELNAPSGNIRHDLEILNEVFGAWQTNFPHEGNPVGENDEITASLAGDNRLRFAFISPTNPAINARGELCDRWGTPFRFHQLSGTQMEIRSAGPDRTFGTPDDVEWSPGPAAARPPL